MARTLKDDEERARRIKLVGDYVLESGASIRETQKHLEEVHKLKISVYTIHEYLKLYQKHSLNGAVIKKVVKENTSQTISNNKEVLKRVKLAFELLKKDFTVQEIAKALDSTVWEIERDLTCRLKKISEEDYKKALEILKQHSTSNLKNQK